MDQINTPKKVILLIEDDAFLVEFYENAFRLQDIEILVARDGEQGLKEIREQKPDFVILDILMPKIDGLTMLKQVREDDELKNTPVMIVSNWNIPEYKKIAENLGVVDYILKIEADPMEIVKRVVNFLGLQKK